MRIRSLCLGLWAGLALTWAPPLLAQVPGDSDGAIPDPRPLTPEEIAEEEARAAEQAEYRAELDTLIRLRLGDTLSPEQRAKITAVIDALPSVRVAENATHELVQHPHIEDVILLVETPGGGLVDRGALWSTMNGARTMTLEQRVAFFAGGYAQGNEWSSNLTPPNEIGDIEDPLFSDWLYLQLLRLARQAAFLELAAVDEHDTISVCLSNEPPPSGYCPHPEGEARWNEAWAGEPLFISVESEDSPANVFTIMAISREGDFIPLATGEGVRYALPRSETIGAQAPASAAPDRVRLFFSPRITLNDRLAPGHYDLFVIATEAPIPPELWRMELTGSVVEEACPEAHRYGLCYAMQGQKRRGLSSNGESAIHHAAIGIRTPVRTTGYLNKGIAASKSVSLWQAQLLRYRPVQSRDSSGRRVVNFKQAHKCGGAYIGDGFVLTAAHCIPDDTSEMRVRLGSRDIRSGGRAFKVRSLVVHERGMAREERVDLALLQLRAAQASLDALGDDLKAVVPSSDPDPGFNALSGLTVTGWGFQKARLPGETGWLAADGSTQTNPDVLEQLLLDEVDETECTARVEYRAYLPKDMLCLRSRVDGGSSCAGDSGGPVTSRMNGGRRLVGIVSSGIGCAYRDLPTVYVNVAEHRDWIARAKRKILTSPPDFHRLD